MKKRSETMKQLSPQAALKCGEAFQTVARRIIPGIRSIQAHSSRDFSEELGNVVACAANLGFAIELYLKALLTQLELPVPQTHNLRVLFDAILQQVRELIESTYDAAMPDQVRELGGHVSVTIAKGPLQEPRWRDNAGVPVSLPQVLERSKDLFPSWRYVFEFTQNLESPYQFHEFEYGLLWCAAEAIRVETTVRLNSAGGIPSASPTSGASQ